MTFSQAIFLSVGIYLTLAGYKKSLFVELVDWWTNETLDFTIGFKTTMIILSLILLVWVSFSHCYHCSYCRARKASYPPRQVFVSFATKSIPSGTSQPYIGPTTFRNMLPTWTPAANPGHRTYTRRSWRPMGLPGLWYSLISKSAHCWPDAVPPP